MPSKSPKPFTSESAREAGKRSGEARRRKKEAAAKGWAEVYGVADIADLDPYAILRSIAGNPRASENARWQSAKFLAQAPEQTEEAPHRVSAQARPDYRPPDWDEVLRVARSVGAID